MHGGLQSHVVGAGQERVERSLLERGPDPGAHLRPLTNHVVAGDSRCAGCGRQQRGEDQHGRRLPGPVWTEEAVDLARRHLEVDSVDRARALAELAYEALDLYAFGLGHRTSPPFARGSFGRTGWQYT